MLIRHAASTSGQLQLARLTCCRHCPRAPRTSQAAPTLFRRTLSNASLLPHPDNRNHSRNPTHGWNVHGRQAGGGGRRGRRVWQQRGRGAVSRAAYRAAASCNCPRKGWCGQRGTPGQPHRANGHATAKFEHSIAPNQVATGGDGVRGDLVDLPVNGHSGELRTASSQQRRARARTAWHRAQRTALKTQVGQAPTLKISHTASEISGPMPSPGNRVTVKRPVALGVGRDGSLMVTEARVRRPSPATPSPGNAFVAIRAHNACKRAQRRPGTPQFSARWERHRRAKGAPV